MKRLLKTGIVGGIALVLQAAPGRAQDLSGTWQGVEITPPRVGSWPAMLTLQKGPGAAITGRLYQQSDQKPSFTGTFEMRGTQTGNVLHLAHVKVLDENTSAGGFWCQGSITFDYDPAEEKLTGRATYRPDGNCSTGIFALYRVRLKSTAAVTAGALATLRASGREVQWFADSARQHLLATGNTFQTRLAKTTTFYLSQGFYATGHSRPIPVTVRVTPAVPLAPARRASPAKAALPVAAPVAVVLPTVLFRATTAELLPDSGPALDRLVASLRARPQLRLRVTGHTDRIGEPGKNQLLSEQRAAAVKAYLVQGGIAAGRIRAVGAGDTRPLYPSPDVRNRRVEVAEIRPGK